MRFRALDGWRGVCALLVALHHMEVIGWIYWQPLVRNAWLFVDFFFVLSGFVIAHAYGDKLASSAGSVRAFVIRRLGRLYPLHIAVLLALIGLELVHLGVQHVHPILGERGAFTADRSLYAIVTNLFLVQSLGFHPYETWNGPAWSISCEFYTYLVFAAVCALTMAHRARVIASVLLAVAGVAILARFSQFGMRETFHWGFARCLFGFFTGVLTYEVWRGGWLKRAGGTLAELAAVAAVLGFIVFVPGNRALEYLATPLFALAVLVFAGERGFVSRAMTTRPMAALGRWSYSIYLVHTLVIAMLFSAVHMGEVIVHRPWLIHRPNGQAIIDLNLGPADDLVMLGFLAAVIALSALTWRLIEQPGQRWFNRLAADRRALVPQTTS